MYLILKVISGPSAGEQWILRPGQAARVGRTEWCDFCIPEDGALGEAQFSVVCTANGARITDLESGCPTQVNGQPVSATSLSNGDRIQAGETILSVQLPIDATEDSPPREAQPQPSVESKDPDPAAPLTAQYYCEMLELSDPARALAEQSDMEPLEYLELLTEQGHFGDAVRLLAAMLPKSQAVQWGSRCVREASGAPAGQESTSDGPSAAMAKALKCAEAWAADPNETARRDAESAARSSGYDSPASWIALAAFWSDGSIGPADQAPVTPPPGLSAQAIGGALALAATQADQPAVQRYQEFLNAGRALYEAAS